MMETKSGNTSFQFQLRQSALKQVQDKKEVCYVSHFLPRIPCGIFMIIILFLNTRVNYLSVVILIQYSTYFVAG